MESTTVFLISTTTILLLFSLVHAQTTKSPTPTPAPAPAPDHVNLTHLLSVAGPYHTFLSYLESTKVMDIFQDRANNSKDGITIFAPTDDAFSSLKRPSLSNLTQDQLKSLCLFHALSHFYSFDGFKNLSQLSPVTTFAGGQYSLNFTDISGTVHISSGWTNTKISSSVLSTNPVAVYQLDNVLLPEAIFGTDIPPMPAPAPSPVTTTAADTPSADAPSSSGTSSQPPESSKPNSSLRTINWGIWSHFLFAVPCLMVMSG